MRTENRVENATAAYMKQNEQHHAISHTLHPPSLGVDIGGSPKSRARLCA